MKDNNLYSDDKVHFAELEINIFQVIQNLKAVKDKIGNKTKLMFVTKAWAYGFGSSTLIKLLEKEALIDYLAVANVDEGAEIRVAGINLPILVLNPTLAGFKKIVDHKLEAEIYSVDLLKDFISYLELEQADISEKIPIHLKFNTGMNRLGCDLVDIPKILAVLKSQEVLEIRSIMTHLSSASISKEDDFTVAQFSVFDKIKKELKGLISSNTMIQVLNSAGTLRFTEHKMDMVRIGIAAYGGINIEESQAIIKPAATFKSKIIQTRRVKAGESISYSRSGQVNADSNIACIALGYGDGFSRNLGNGNWEIEINGKLYPTIGNVCMDITMVNLGNDEAVAGDEAIVFGGTKSLFDYAQAQETIPYESLTSINHRVKRTYIKN